MIWVKAQIYVLLRIVLVFISARCCQNLKDQCQPSDGIYYVGKMQRSLDIWPGIFCNIGLQAWSRFAGMELFVRE